MRPSGCEAHVILRQTSSSVRDQGRRATSRRQLRRVPVSLPRAGEMDAWQTGRGGRLAEGGNGHHTFPRPALSVADRLRTQPVLWRPLRTQTSAAVIEQLDSVFWERGAPEELLTDNDPAFRSRQFEAFAAQWSMRMRYRCAHQPSGNGIAERCHRSVKVTAARKNCTVAEAVYWHNVSPRADGGPESAPAELLYRYRVRVRGVDGPAAADREDTGADHSESAPYRRGDRVWVRPPGARCDEQYAPGIVTDAMSEQAVAVDGMPRHTRGPAPADWAGLGRQPGCDCGRRRTNHGEVPGGRGASPAAGGRAWRTRRSPREAS